MQILKIKYMNRILVSILLTMGFAYSLSAQEKEYQLVWSDEFDVEGEPSTEWSYESGFVRNEELQWYQSQNAKVKDGCLVIEAKKGFFINPHYEAFMDVLKSGQRFLWLQAPGLPSGCWATSGNGRIMARLTSWNITSKMVSRRFSPMPAGARLNDGKVFGILP